MDARSGRAAANLEGVMKTIGAGLALLAFSSLADVRPSVAEIYRPWCVEYTHGGGTSCAFTSFEQCMLTARGAGASCAQNPWYLRYGPGSDGTGRPERAKRR